MNLTDEQIEAVLALWKSGSNTWVISQKTGVDERYVISIVSKKQEATKPQEPCNFIASPDEPKGIKYPQPCPSCAEKQSAIDVWESRYTDLSYKCANLADKCAELEADLAKANNGWNDCLDDKHELERSLNKCQHELSKYHHGDNSRVDLMEANSRIKELEAELERERMRLAACGVVALANTPESAAKQREMLPEYESGSLESVKHIVDSEMALRAERDALKKQNNAYATLTTSQEGRLIEYGGQQAKWLDAVATLDSEKEANAILTQERDALKANEETLQEYAANLVNELTKTQIERDALKADLEASRDSLKSADTLGAAIISERDALAMQVAKMREALTKVLPWVVTQEVACNGLKCREAVCMSCRSDSEEAANKACEAYANAKTALSLPDNSSEIIKRHDAALLNKLVKDWRDGGFENAIPGWHIDNLAAELKLEVK